MAFGGLKSLLFGKPEKQQQMQRFTPEQQQVMSQIFGGLGGEEGAVTGGIDYLRNLLSGQGSAYEAQAAPFQRQFQEQTVPQLAERFAGADALGSSAFGQSLGQAGAGLQENLAALQGQQQLQGLQGLMSLLGIAQTPQIENILKPRTPGTLEIGAGVAAKALPLFF